MIDDRVPVDMFRTRFLDLLASGCRTADDVARDAGYWGSGKGDTRRLRKKLGLDAHVSKKLVNGEWQRYEYVQKTVSYGDAVDLCRALHLDPVDVGV